LPDFYLENQNKYRIDIFNLLKKKIRVGYLLFPPGSAKKMATISWFNSQNSAGEQFASQRRIYTSAGFLGQVAGAGEKRFLCKY
jgi:hypothetical protein